MQAEADGFGPIFTSVTRDGKRASDTRLNNKNIARLIKARVTDAGLCLDLPDVERVKLCSGHRLRAGLASSAEVDERYVQKQLGHASDEMTRRYQRRHNRFRVNLTKAAGLSPPLPYRGSKGFSIATPVGLKSLTFPVTTIAP